MMNVVCLSTTDIVDVTDYRSGRLAKGKKRKGKKVQKRAFWHSSWSFSLFLPLILDFSS